MKVNISSTDLSILNKFSSTPTATANTRSSYTTEDLGQLIPKLVSMVTTLCEQREEDRKELQRRDGEIELLKNQMRELSDELDEARQRNMKGNIIVSSIPSDNKPSLIKTGNQLKTSVTKHACDLMKQKYKVDVPEEDIQACHSLPNNQIIVRFANRRPESAWSSLKENIVKGGSTDINVYANFQLTKRRNSLLYSLRKAKKDGKISKIYSNENGQISYKVTDNAVKTKVTYFSTKKHDSPKTLTVSELRDQLK